MSQEDMRYLIAVAGLLVGGYGLITRPITSEIKTQNAQLELRFMREIESLRKEIHEMEKRINDRLDAWVVRK